MRRVIAFLLAAPAIARAVAGEFAGLHLPPYPQGLVEHDGACIRLADRSQPACTYGFAVLEDAARTPRVLYAGRLEGRENSGKPKWLVLDSFRIPKLPRGYRMALAECEEDGIVDETIVAAVRSDESKASLDDVLFAKRFDLRNGT